MSKIIRGLGLLLIVVLLSSCGGSKVKSRVSEHGTEVRDWNRTIVYGLPRTRFEVEVDIVHTVIKRGPYAEYASRMLGLENVSLKDGEQWRVGDIRVKSATELDPSRIYTLSFKNYPSNVHKLLGFTESGLMLDLNRLGEVAKSDSEASGEDFRFVNATIKGNMVETMDTVYRTILTDTAFVRVPILQRKLSGRSMEEQAREASQQIFNLRQMRLDMLSGNTDYHPDGEALRLILESMDRQEGQLLSLFNGAQIEKKQTLRYQLLPTVGVDRAVLFYFSDRNGISKQNTAGSKSVWISWNQPSTLQGEDVEVGENVKNLLYYRIPGMLEVRSGVDKTEMLHAYHQVYQLGRLVGFPLEVK